MKTLELLGKRFGKLVVIAQGNMRKTRGNRTNSYWICKCDCGKVIESRGGSLTSGDAKSCRCQIIENNKRIRTLPKGEAAFRLVVGSYKTRAKSKNLKFTLTTEQLKTLFKGNCFYCGQVPKNRSGRRIVSGSFTYNGLDRVDSNLGYESFNVVSCCRICNIMKNNLEKEEFLQQIKCIHDHNFYEKSSLFKWSKL